MLHECFKKIKITENAVKEEDTLYSKQKELKSKTDPESKKKLAEIEEELVNLKSKDLHNIIKEEIEQIDCEAGRHDICQKFYTSKLFTNNFSTQKRVNRDI